MNLTTNHLESWDTVEKSTGSLPVALAEIVAAVFLCRITINWKREAEL
jgi:hypothetical protein